MSIEALTARIAHLEGSVEQVDKRLTAVEQAVIALHQEMAAGFAALRQEMTIRFEGMDRKSLALMGMMVASWATLIAAIFLHH